MKSAAARALKWHEEGHKGGTNIGLGRARSIVAGESLSASTVKRMHSFFSRHAVDKKAPGFNSGPKFPSPGRVAWDLWGGNAGASWSAKIAAKLDKTAASDDGLTPICVDMNHNVIKEGDIVQVERFDNQGNSLGEQNATIISTGDIDYDYEDDRYVTLYPSLEVKYQDDITESIEMDQDLTELNWSHYPNNHPGYTLEYPVVLLQPSFDTTACVRCGSNAKDIVCEPCNEQIIALAAGRAFNPLALPTELDQTQSEEGKKICFNPQCGAENDLDAEECFNCGQSWTYTASIKTAVLEDEPQSSLPDGASMPPNTAEPPGMMGENPMGSPPQQQNLVVQPTLEVVRMQIANSGAAQEFSKLDNLDDADEVIASLSQQYNLPDTYIKNHLLVKATFGDITAVNGEIDHNIDEEKFEKVTPDVNSETQIPFGPNASDGGTKIQKGVAIPYEFLEAKVMEYRNVSEVNADSYLEDIWGGLNPPLGIRVPVEGEVEYYLPIEALGGKLAPEVPENPLARPEDVMDQEYNQYPMQ